MTRHSQASPGSRRRRLSLLSGLVLLQALLAVSQAQITLDGSLGPRGPLTGPHYRIGADVGQIRGSNLFHSFEQFNVPTRGSATFAGPNTVANIVGRVTGGQPSAIDGVLRSEIAGANLYLLNPSGVLFGPNAALDVSGSFHVSTADALRFADGATFAAHLGQESVLTVAAPAAFGFLSANPTAISIRESVLRVPQGKTLSIISGGIDIVGGPFGRLTAPSGRIQLASVASSGDVRFSPLELAPDLQVDSFTRLGQLALSQDALSQDALLDVSGNGGGTVLLRSSRAEIDRSAIFANNTGLRDGSGLGVDLRADVMFGKSANITTDSMRAGRARDLQITAGSVHLDNSVISSTPFGSGDGGNIAVNVGNLILTSATQIDAGTRGNGRGGVLTVVATDTISISGRDRQGNQSGLFSSTFSRGDAGRLFISASTLTMDDGLIRAGAEPRSSGNAGRLELRAERITLTGGAQISSPTFGPGRGGEVTVVATDTLAVAGRNQSGPSGVFANANRGSSGDAGRLEVRAERITLTGGAQISSTTFSRGRGGEVTVVATDTLAVAGRSEQGLVSALQTGTFSTGGGGHLHVQARHIELSNEGTITTTSRGDGAAGTALIQANETFRSQGGRVASASERAGGGTIALTAGRLIHLLDSELSTSVRGGGSDAGNLTLDAPFIVAEDSQIIANAFGGRGGNIRFEADVFLADPTSLVSASSTLGIQGTVEIRAPVTSLSGALAPLPQAFVTVAALLPARCAARLSGGQASSLVLSGRDGLPADPSGVLPSPLTLDDRLTAGPGVIGASPRQPSPARFALLADRDKALPRLGCPH